MTDHPAPSPNQPDALAKKARAEAEKRLRGKRMTVGTVVDREVDAFTIGYLAGAAAVLPEVERRAKEAEYERVLLILHAHGLGDMDHHLRPEKGDDRG